MGKSRNIVVIGPDGQIGYELLRSVSPLGNIIGIGRNNGERTIDLADPDSIVSAFNGLDVDVIINAAAYTAVDKAEEEPDIAMAVNGVAPGILAEIAARNNARFIHYSTDYIFDGKKTEPYLEDDKPNPLSIYGKTKLAGESAVSEVSVDYTILRTSWVYGARGKNFLRTILRLAREKEQLQIINDQTGSPTWSRAIAETTAFIISTYINHGYKNNGIYHVSSSGSTTWYGFAKKIIDMYNPENVPGVTSILGKDYPLPAERPVYSVLNNTKLKEEFGITLPNWQYSLEQCIMDMKRPCF